jgi:hypothetical protein
VKHRDEVEAPMTDWLQEAYDLAGAAPPAKPAAKAKTKPPARVRTATTETRTAGNAAVAKRRAQKTGS